jgi:hypothetical protein
MINVKTFKLLLLFLINNIINFFIIVDFSFPDRSVNVTNCRVNPCRLARKTIGINKVYGFRIELTSLRNFIIEIFQTEIWLLYRPSQNPFWRHLFLLQEKVAFFKLNKYDVRTSVGTSVLSY